jgi:dihydroorotate dehydrogenase
MYKIIRSLLFFFDPEKVHYFTAFCLRMTLSIPIVSWLWKRYFIYEDKGLERTLFGITFKNPIGLAAGFDKNATMYKDLASCGFGFIEIGTVTPLAQDGNPKKRLFRLKKDEAIINRMGFNNKGVEEAIENLKNKPKHLIIGGNIGKNTATIPENYTADYEVCFKALHPYVDYFVVNVSCPNVGSHAKLQDKEYLVELLGTLKDLNNKERVQKPILLKIAPDLSNIQLDEIIELVDEVKLDGVIATNTTTDRSNLVSSKEVVESIGNGGLSGKPLTNRSTEVIRYLATKSNKSFPIIGVGGIHSVEDAIEKLDAGADLLQLYTGFIYEGPGLIKRINQAILNRK